MISIVIPNFNGMKHLKTCYDSLKEQSVQDFEIILVDNNSKDDSIKFSEEYVPGIKVLKFDYNTGFAKAVNEGIKISRSEFILLLNNDTECDKYFLEEMLNGFKSKDTGSVACKMVNYYDRKLIDDAGDFVKGKGSPYARGYSETDSGQYDKEEFIFGACAGAAMFRNEVINKAGLYDEDFFAYYEDVDLSFRLQIAGYKCFYNPKAICYHKRGGTTGDNNEFQTMLCEKNLVALRIKNYPALMYIMYQPYFIFVRAKRYYLFLTKHSYSLFSAAVKGYLRGLLDIPKSLKKRSSVQKLRTVSTDYLKSILK